MALAQLDVSVRLGGIATILLVAWLLFRQRRDVGLPASLFLPLAICLTGFLIGNTPDPSLRLTGTAAAIAHFVSGCTVVFLWWFCLACFDTQFRPRDGVLATGVFWFVLATIVRVAGLSVPALSYTLVGLGFGIVSHLVWRLYSERDGDLIQKRYNARAMVALLLGGQLLIDLTVDLIFGFGWRPLAFAMAQNVAILAFVLWLARQVFEVRSGVLSFGGGYAPAADVVEAPAVLSELRQRLMKLIEQDRLHLDPDLTFATFVDRMNAPERTVRKLVNHELGFDHFRSFLNHYRLEEARRLLADPARAQDKLIAIALDSGFGSLPSFNRVFRAAEACTPSEYKEAALSGRAPLQTRDSEGASSRAPPIENRSAAF
jgi:AraC-like DNA-binding protein